MTGIKKMQMRELEVPVPKDDEILVKIEYVGICGSDVHYFERGRIGDYVVERDFILGHECAGIVVKTGKRITNLGIGDKVTLEPGKTCGQCEYCKAGKYNLCPNVEFLATPPYNGCLMDFITYPADLAFKIPENLSTREGALIEPLAVGIHAANQGSVKLGETVVILGAGCIGLVTLLACRAFGATKVIVVDVLEKRLDYAKKLGANEIINAKEEDVLVKVNELTNNNGASVVIETAGSKETTAQTANIVKKGGRIVLVGLTPEELVGFNFQKIIDKEVEIKTVFRYRNIFPIAINALADGRLSLGNIITHEFDFEDSEDAFNYVINNKNDVVKAIIKL